MNKKEYIIKLDTVATFENKQVRVEDLLEQLFKENKQLKDNWNKLKEWFQLNIDKPNIKFILETMQELEK